MTIAQVVAAAGSAGEFRRRVWGLELWAWWADDGGLTLGRIDARHRRRPDTYLALEREDLLANDWEWRAA